MTSRLKSLVLVLCISFSQVLLADLVWQTPDGVYEKYQGEERFWVDSTVPEVVTARSPFPFSPAWFWEAWKNPGSMLPDWWTIVRYGPYALFAGTLLAASMNSHLFTRLGLELLSSSKLHWLWRKFSYTRALLIGVSTLWYGGNYAGRYFMPGSSQFYPLTIDWSGLAVPFMIMIVKDRPAKGGETETVYRIIPTPGQRSASRYFEPYSENDEYLFLFTEVLHQQGINLDIVLSESPDHLPEEETALSLYGDHAFVKNLKVRAWNNRGVMREGVFEINTPHPFIEDVLVGQRPYEPGGQYLSIMMEKVLIHIGHWLMDSEQWQWCLFNNSHLDSSRLLPGPDLGSDNGELQYLPGLLVREDGDEKILDLGALQYRLPGNLALSPETSGSLALLFSSLPVRPVEMLSRDRVAGLLFFDQLRRLAMLMAVESGLHYMITRHLGGYRIVFTSKQESSTGIPALADSGEAAESLVINARPLSTGQPAFEMHVEYVGDDLASGLSRDTSPELDIKSQAHLVDLDSKLLVTPESDVASLPLPFETTLTELQMGIPGSAAMASVTDQESAEVDRLSDSSRPLSQAVEEESQRVSAEPEAGAVEQHDEPDVAVSEMEYQAGSGMSAGSGEEGDRFDKALATLREHSGSPQRKNDSLVANDEQDGQRTNAFSSWKSKLGEGKNSVVDSQPDGFEMKESDIRADIEQNRLRSTSPLSWKSELPEGEKGAVYDQHDSSEARDTAATASDEVRDLALSPEPPESLVEPLLKSQAHLVDTDSKLLMTPESDVASLPFETTLTELQMGIPGPAAMASVTDQESAEVDRLSGSSRSLSRAMEEESQRVSVEPEAGAVEQHDEPEVAVSEMEYQAGSGMSAGSGEEGGSFDKALAIPREQSGSPQIRTGSPVANDEQNWLISTPLLSWESELSEGEKGVVYDQHDGSEAKEAVATVPDEARGLALSPEPPESLAEPLESVPASDAGQPEGYALAQESRSGTPSMASNVAGSEEKEIAIPADGQLSETDIRISASPASKSLSSIQGGGLSPEYTDDELTGSEPESGGETELLPEESAGQFETELPELSMEEQFLAMSTEEKNSYLESLVLETQLAIPEEYRSRIVDKARVLGVIKPEGYSSDEQNLEALRIMSSPLRFMAAHMPIEFFKTLVIMDTENISVEDIHACYTGVQAFMTEGDGVSVMKTAPMSGEVVGPFLPEIPFEALVAAKEYIRKQLKQLNAPIPKAHSTASLPSAQGETGKLDDVQHQTLIAMSRAYYILKGVTKSLEQTVVLAGRTMTPEEEALKSHLGEAMRPVIGIGQQMLMRLIETFRFYRRSDKYYHVHFIGGPEVAGRQLFHSAPFKLGRENTVWPYQAKELPRYKPEKQ